MYKPVRVKHSPRKGVAKKAIKPQFVTSSSASDPTRQPRIPLRAVVYPHQQWWIAHCLELDLAAEGSTPVRAARDLMDLAATMIDDAKLHGNLRTIFQSAPAEIWELYARSNDLTIGVKLPRSVERFEMREAALS